MTDEDRAFHRASICLECAQTEAGRLSDDSGTAGAGLAVPHGPISVGRGARDPRERLLWVLWYVPICVHVVALL